MPKNTKKTKGEGVPADLRKKALWTIVFLAIAVLTVWAVTSHAKDFSFRAFWSFLGGLHPAFVCAAFVAMLLYILFEGLALLSLARGLGHPRSLGKGYTYSAADIYFSAITPSATGGQPASAYLMIKDGIPGSVVTVALLLNLIMYTFSIILLGVLAFLLAPSVFLHFSLASKILILAGFAVQIGLAFVFILLLKKSSILRFLGHKGISLLAKLRLVRRVEKKREKLDTSIDSYERCVASIGKKRRILIVPLIFNVLQRSMLIAVTVFAFLAAGGTLSRSIDVWSAECMVVLGSNFVPIPGAMGIADGLMLDVFKELCEGAASATNLELLSRAISFYLCVILCGISFLARCVQLSAKSRKRTKEDKTEPSEEA